MGSTEEAAPGVTGGANHEGRYRDGRFRCSRISTDTATRTVRLRGARPSPPPLHAAARGPHGATRHPAPLQGTWRSHGSGSFAPSGAAPCSRPPLTHAHTAPGARAEAAACSSSDQTCPYSDVRSQRPSRTEGQEKARSYLTTWGALVMLPVRVGDHQTRVGKMRRAEPAPGHTLPLAPLTLPPSRCGQRIIA